MEEVPIPEALRRFEPLSALNGQQLAQVAEHVKLLRAARGTCLMDIGSQDPRVLFLIDGELELVAADGARRRLRHGDPAAKGPVSRLRPSRYRVSAVTEVRYLWVDPGIVDRLCRPTAPALVVDEAYSDGDTGHPGTAPELMADVLDDLHRRRIIVPSEPDIAIRIGRALGEPGIDDARMTEILMLCPALTIKAIRAARSAARDSGIRDARQAVTALGGERVHELATRCVLRESLRSRSDAVRQRIRLWWRRALRTSRVCRVLAEEGRQLDPEQAAMVGLLARIAEPVLLNYADRYAELDSATALEAMLETHHAELGRILLAYWSLPRALVEAAGSGLNWHYDHAGEADYTDIALIAHWHATIGEAGHHAQPRLSEIPAAARLGMAQPSPGRSLRILEAARSAEQHAESLLGTD
jgi:HD-like signal output (HDOD) protein